MMVRTRRQFLHLAVQVTARIVPPVESKDSYMYYKHVPRYPGHESCRHGSMDHASDGCLLWEILSTRLPMKPLPPKHLFRQSTRTWISVGCTYFPRKLYLVHHLLLIFSRTFLCRFFDLTGLTDLTSFSISMSHYVTCTYY